MTPHRTRDIGRTLVVLRGGPWAGSWYWRDDLEQMQRSARRFPSEHPSAVMSNYRPSRGVENNPAGFGEGQVWTYTPPPAAAASDVPVSVHLHSTGAVDAPATRS